MILFRIFRRVMMVVGVSFAALAAVELRGDGSGLLARFTGAEAPRGIEFKSVADRATSDLPQVKPRTLPRSAEDIGMAVMELGTKLGLAGGGGFYNDPIQLMNSSKAPQGRKVVRVEPRN